jgi:hypothetical protein
LFIQAGFGLTALMSSGNPPRWRISLMMLAGFGAASSVACR